ncbi:pyridoxamine 5'-phosphate oxidase [Fodinibius sediminis]|uniref:Pyridoxamine 5'-phosphate oxidase n=1 Tax=Fodinibius sediminis TaxID=1214077 RepID=A0A521F4Q9_9BACT|nr:pyridoxamine 5'-phosphate oxidase [Fodinibius sediminis]SMO91197.1 Pyridoxamine 5'-phosphate oxidase [Fodinibius sediminis]
MSKETEQDKVAKLRRDYTRQMLTESAVEDSPISQFNIWFKQALSAEMLDPNAMTLSTATKEGVPSSRIVLFKGVDEDGFRFYSNYASRKGRELEENPKAALCFYWPPLERQVRVEGDVEKMNREASADYFRQRPRLSQLGAWASQQSSRVASREELENMFQKTSERFENKPVPLPDFWGGFVLKPVHVEFWQGRKGRLHDRICYEKKGDEWNIFRLAP